MVLGEVAKRAGEAPSGVGELGFDGIEEAEEAVLDAAQPVVDVLQLGAQSGDEGLGTLGIVEELAQRRQVRVGGAAEPLLCAPARHLYPVDRDHAEADGRVDDVGQPVDKIRIVGVDVRHRLVTRLRHHATVSRPPFQAVRGYVAGAGFGGTVWPVVDSLDAPESQEVRAVPAAPQVEIVVVAHEPGEWFEDALASLSAQDYQRCSITVLAAGSAEDVSERVGRVIRDADVTEVDERFGYGRSVNQLLGAENPPAFYLFCHDDVALAPDALRLLIEEALRSNASVAGPKLVHWDRPDELVDVGLDVDKLGHVAPRVEPGELDQEQHDAVSDVFAVSGAVQLVRADLFEALEGFDAAMGVIGEDVDFCWRSHVAGARVMIVPSAVARHRMSMGERRSDVTLERLRERHRIRTLLSVYGVLHSIRVLPQALLYSILRALGALVVGRFGVAGAATGGWIWNLRHPGSLLRRRALLRSIRKVPDGEIRNLQVGGFAPVSHFLRGTLTEEGGGSLAARSRNVIRALRTGPSRLSLAFWAITAVMLIFGSRHLVTQRVPAVGDLVPFDLGPTELLGRWFDSWWSTGTGHEGAAPTAFGLVGVLGVVFLGAMGLLRTVLTVGMIPIGAIGMWRFLRPFASPWIRVIGAMLYLAAPVPYNALANGTWSALLLYGLLPWVLAGLGRAAQVAPFGRLGGGVGEGVFEPAWTREVLALGLPIAFLGAFEPFVLLIVAGMVVALVLGSMLAGWPGGSPRLVAITAGALAVAALLHLPWLVDAIGGEPSWDWIGGTRPETPVVADLDALLRLDTGRLGGAPLGWALPMAGLIPLLLARGPRWAWAVRGLTLYLAAVAAVWAAGEGWVPFSLPRPETILVVGALGLAVSAAMGVAAIERDLRTYRFGWRQLAPITAVAAVGLAMLPVTGATFDGRWRMPATDFNSQLAQQAEGQEPHRVLWIGHDDVLSAGGRRFLDNLSVAVTADLESQFVDRWAGVPEPADPLVLEALELALDGGTSRLGKLLAPFAIGEIIVLQQSAPTPAIGLVQPVPDAVLAALTEQLDLAEIDLSPGVTRYRNTSVLPVAAVVPSGTLAGSSLRSFAASATPVNASSLTAHDASRRTFEGAVTTADEVFAAVPASSSWRLVVDDRVASRSPTFDWAVTFQPVVSGEAVLSHRTSAGHRILIAGQAAAWVFAVVALLRLNARSREYPR